MHSKKLVSNFALYCIFTFASSGCWIEPTIKIDLPVVKTWEVTEITPISASSGGEVVSDGGDPVTERGMWLSSNDSGKWTTIILKNALGGIGPYVRYLKGLKPGTNYEVSAYAINKAGTGFGESRSFTTDSVLTLGLNYYGGIIFYLDQTMKHGMLCTETDLGEIVWGCNTKRMNGADKTGLGSGLQNTMDIIKDCNEDQSAAALSFNLTDHGFSDWYLPSEEEVVLMYTNLFMNGYGGLATANAYWSSTQSAGSDPTMVRAMSFKSGLVLDKNKNKRSYFRAVRNF